MYEDARRFLMEDPLQRVQGLFSLDRGTADIIQTREDGLLLYETKGEVYLLFTKTREAAQALLNLVPEVDILFSDNSELDDWLMRERGFTYASVCHGVAYMKKQPLPHPSGISLEPLGVDKADLVLRHYHNYDVDTLKLFIREEQLLGAYVEDVLVGFIGWHDEGAMGMLHVFEEFRRKGYARAMEALQVNLILARGEIPFGQVVMDNHASLDLQKKLGFSVAEKPVSWLFK